MADSTSRPNASGAPDLLDRPDDPGPDHDRGALAGPPRWVYVAGVIVGVLAVVFVLLHLVGGGHGHGVDHTGGHADHGAQAR